MRSTDKICARTWASLGSALVASSSQCHGQRIKIACSGRSDCLSETDARPPVSGIYAYQPATPVGASRIGMTFVDFASPAKAFRKV